MARASSYPVVGAQTVIEAPRGKDWRRSPSPTKRGALGHPLPRCERGSIGFVPNSPSPALDRGRGCRAQRRR